MEHKKRQHFLATLLMPFGSWWGTFWSFASKTTKQKLLIGCYRILTIQRVSGAICGNKKSHPIILSGMLRPSARVFSLTYTTNQNKNAIFPGDGNFLSRLKAVRGLRHSLQNCELHSKGVKHHMLKIGV